MTDQLALDVPAKKPPGLKIIRLQAENIKKLTAVSITPQGNVVQITGKNGSGKTSTLNSIWWALAGAGNVQAVPIRKGQDKATIKLDLGEVVITRTFQKRGEGEQPGTTITVESADGARFPSPQRMLDSLLGSLSLDPLAFARMQPKQQFDALKGFVPGIDFAKLEGLNRADYEKRTAVNRRVKELEAQASAIAIPEVVPEPVDEDAIVKEIGQVGEFNGKIEAQKLRREQAATEIQTKRKEADDAMKRAKLLRAEADGLEEAAKAADARADMLSTKLKKAPPLDEPKSAADVQARLAAAKKTNSVINLAQRRKQLQDEASKAKAEADALTEAMEARDKAKADAIATAKLPVEGLGFGADMITLNGVPFDQASDAEQLRASCAIAMAGRGKLSVILVRDGSLLDENGWKLLNEMADANDCQVWAEAVDSTGKVGIVMEDGHVASTPESRAAHAQAAE